MLLVLDTATGSIGAAVLEDGSVLSEVTHHDSRRHGELLAPAIDEAITRAGATVADLTSIVVGVGPGPFTGLRVGIVTGLVMGHVRDIPVHGVCSLDALAEQAVADGIVAEPFLVATDARRKEVYWGAYAVEQGLPVRVGGPGVDHPNDLPDDLRSRPAVGRGPLLYDSLRDVGGPVDVRPGYLGLVAHRALTNRADASVNDGVLLPPEPLYLRRPDATEPGPAKVAS